MKQDKYIKVILILIGIITGIVYSCRNDYYPVPPPPKIPKSTAALEANWVTTPPSNINSTYWKSADYLKIETKNINTNSLYGNGLLNMTGTYSGLSSFNDGADPKLTLKAAYDTNNLYILAEWIDSDVDLSQASLLWKGPSDPLKSDDPDGWTSQRNSDKLALAFEIESASSSQGNFQTIGCAASCHTANGNLKMHPQTGKVDLWNWNLAISAPLGYLQDMIANADSLSDDEGQKMFAHNTANGTNRSAPAYEWDGTPQSILQPTGQASLLDPTFYLFNKTPFVGDAVKGNTIYSSDIANKPGHCFSCHGDYGEGATAAPINTITMNKKSRAALKEGMDNVPDMAPYWAPLSESEKDNIIAFIRGLSGVPGNYLIAPIGSNADITSLSNITPVQITNATLPSTNKHTTYQVLITRKLKTQNADDIQFDLAASREYKFGIALMDNDGKNHIGSLAEILTFK